MQTGFPLYDLGDMPDMDRYDQDVPEDPTRCSVCRTEPFEVECRKCGKRFCSVCLGEVEYELEACSECVASVAYNVRMERARYQRLSAMLLQVLSEMGDGRSLEVQ